MDPFHLPDTVLGLGGAGKSLVFNMLRQQSGDGEYWFLNELMSERNRDLNRVNFFTIDTATVETKDDRPKVREIHNAIEDIEEQNRVAGIEQYPNVNHEYVNIGEDISNVYTNRDSFIHTREVGERLSQTDLTHWWLAKDDLRSGLDFSEGVYRRRARSKGMYYAAKQGGEKIPELVASTRNKVALVTALGGGTGSGMFIDLAREINADGVEVTLFAVLPNSEEDAEKRANAHAALSELEFLQLTDQNPFTQIVLLPFEPVIDGNDPKGYDKEFMDAFPYTFLSFYNLVSNIRHDSLECTTSSYHPFTIAAPQVIRYNTAHIKQAEQNLESFLEEKETLLDQEKQLYNALETFLEENNESVTDTIEELNNDNFLSIPENSKIGPRSRTILEQRFDDIQTLINLEIFDQLDYESARAFDSLVSNASNSEGTIVDTIRDLEDRIGINDPRKEVSDDVAGKDHQLAEILYEEIDAIIQKARVLEISERAGDENIRDYLVKSLNIPSEDNEAEGYEVLRNKQKSVIQEKQQLENRLENLSNVVEETNQVFQSEIDQITPTLEKKAKQIRLIDQHEQELLTTAQQVDAEIQGVEAQINRTDDPDEVQRISFDHNLSDFSILDEIGIEKPPADATDFQRAVGYVTKARAEALKEDSEASGIVGKAKKWIEGDDTEHQDKYEGYITSLQKQSPFNANQIATLPRWDRREGDVEFVINFEQSVERQLTERRSEILNEFNAAYEELLEELADNGQLSEGVYSTLQNISPSEHEIQSMIDSDQQLSEVIKDTLSQKTLEETQSELTELEDQIENKEKVSSLYLNAIQFYRDYSEITDYASEESKLREKLEEIGVAEDTDVLDDNYRYIKRKDPAEVYKALGTDDIRDGDFWEREQLQIKKEIRNNLVGSNICESNRFLRLQATGSDLISADQNTRRSGYNEHGIYPVFMSRLFDETKDTSFNIREEFNDFNLNAGQGERNQYEETIMQNGGPWDIAVTVFVGGVFLDNLREMQGGSGSLRRAYDYQKNNGSDAIRLHHSWGLGGEDRSGRHDSNGGIYVSRNGIMNLAATQADDKSVRLSEPATRFLNNATDEEIKETILSEFYDVSEFVLEHGYNNSNE